MPVQHETVMFDVHDCKVAALLADETGERPTYGPKVDVPGISEVGLDPNFVTAELKGDARVIAKKGRIDRVNFSGTYSKLNLDVQAVLLGTAVVDVAAITAASLASVSTTAASAVVTGTGFTANLVGRAITGTGVPAGTRVIEVTSATELVMSAEATASGTVTLTVAAVGEKAVSRLASPAPLTYFGLWFQISDLSNGVGDLHVAVYKATLTGGSLIGSSSDNFGQPSFDAEGIALEGHLDKPDFSGFDEGVMMDTTFLSEITPIA